MNSRWIHGGFALVMFLAQMPGWPASSAETLERGVYQEETAGNIAEAMQIYAGLVKEEQVNRIVVAEAMYRLGSCYRKTGDTEKARTTFEQLLERYPEQSKYAELARKELASLPGGAPDEKTKELLLKVKQAQIEAKQMQLSAQDRKVKSGEQSQLGWLLWQGRQLTDAEARFKDAVEADPENANAWNGLGWSQSNQGKNVAAAIAFQKCIELNPKHPGALNGLGWCAKAQGKTEEAISWWKKAIEAAPGATAALNGLVVASIEQKKYDEAIKYCEQWLEREPNSPDAQSQLQYVKALASGDKSAEDMPVQGKYTPDKVRSADVDYFFKYLGREPEPGFHQFAAMWALIDKGKLGETTVTDAIIDKARQFLESDRTDVTRWHACYVLSGIGDPRAIPILAKVLKDDRDDTVRGVAACALGAFGQLEARAILEAMAEREKSPSVKEWIHKALSGQFVTTGRHIAEAVENSGGSPDRAATTVELDVSTTSHLVAKCMEKLKELKDRQVNRRNIGWLDKNDIADVYEKWAESAPPREVKEAEVAALKQYLAQVQADPFCAWRLNHLLAAAELDLGRPEEAAAYLDNALAAYTPATNYCDPSKQSKYHHIVHERAKLIWQKDGVEAAENYFLDKLAKDPKCEFFHSWFWEHEYKEKNMEERLVPLLERVKAAYAERKENFPDKAAQIDRYLGHLTAYMQTRAAEQGKAQ